MNTFRAFQRTSRPRLVQFLILALAFLPVTGSAAAFRLRADPINRVLPQLYRPGASVTLQPSISNVPEGQYQWFHDALPVAGGVTTVLRLDPLTAADTGNYRLRVTSGASTSWSDTATVNVVSSIPASAVDRGFSSKLNGVGPYHVVGVAADGSVYVSLDTEGIGKLSRLKPAGQVDPGFNTAGAPSAGMVLAVLRNGQLIVSSSPYRHDTTGAAAPLALPAALEPSTALTAAADQRDGKLLIAQGTRLVRLNADDSLDTTFNYVSPLGDAPHSITSLKFDRTGRIYVYAQRTDPDPSHFPSSWTVVYRLTATGAADAGFAQQSPIYNSGSVEVYPLDDGRVLRLQNHKGASYWAMLRDDGTADPGWTAHTFFQLGSPVVDPAGHVFYLDEWGAAHRLSVTATGLIEDPTFYAGDGRAFSLTLAPNHGLIVTGDFAAWDQHTTSSVARLRSDDVAPVWPPNASIYARDTWPQIGSPYRLDSIVTGTTPLNYEWLALDGQPLPADRSGATLAFERFAAANLGRYQLRVTSASGVSVLSNVVEVEATGEPFLANLSGRARTGEGEDTVIAGFVVQHDGGGAGLPLLLRGVGPGLADFKVTDPVPNPTIDVFDRNAQVVANNDQWPNDQTVAATAQTVGAFPLASGSNDAALLRSFGSGVSTIHLRAVGNSQGVGLAEIYRVSDSAVSGRLLNLSFRARTGPGDNAAIAGFVINDPGQFNRRVRVLLRAVGPSLAPKGITHPLANPVLTVFNRAAEVLASNDDWAKDNTSGDASTLAAAMTQVGAFELATDSKDAALLLELPPGAYTMHANGGEGVVLLEIYVVR